MIPKELGDYLQREHMEFNGEEETVERSSERMEYRKLRTKNGAEFFLKQVKDAELQKQIKAQYEGARILGRFFDESSPLEAEKVVAIGPDWLLTEWIEGRPLMVPDDIGTAKGDEGLVVFADMLAYMDSKSDVLPASGGGLRFGSKTPAEKFTERTTEKTRFMLERGVASELVEGVIQTIEGAIPHMTPALQHGDLTPWHIMERSLGKPVLIDCEHVSTNWPRYYDIANFYSQLSVRFGRDDLAESLLQNVSGQTGKPIADSLDFRMMVLMRHFIRAVEYKDDEEKFQRALQKTEAWHARYT